MDGINPQLAERFLSLKQDGSYAAQSFARELLRKAYVAKQVSTAQYHLFVRKTYCWNSLKSLTL